MDTAEQMVTALRDQGLRITAARRAVCRILADSQGEHLTAADIYDRTSAIDDLTVDQSTVYRTLETLEESGLVQHTHMGHGALVYHLAAEPPHQHLVCAGCGRTMAVPEAELSSFFTAIAAATGFVPDPTHVALSGLCPDCAEPRSGSSPR
jgi:Fur family ferric uptake transcriptional regulator